MYKRFLELKLKPRTKAKEQKLKSFNENILCPNFHKKTVDINMLIEFSKENKNLEEFIIKMKYSDFLKTLYWRSITKYKKERSNYKCELCGSTENLQIHHKTYIHHGKEIFYLNDLIVLCGRCHKNEHKRFCPILLKD